ncbi:hypothetical protein [Veillonella ratti]|uniref:hypothetical protein n=1 Tax=Veillonella ratti TaxID=103892 RepID=UPI000F8DA834|nr:hypothetical protein [Veillonella ratti]
MEIEEFRAGLLRELNAIDSKYAGLIKNKNNLLMCAVELNQLIDKIWKYNFLFSEDKEEILRIAREIYNIYGMNNTDCILEALKMSYNSIFKLIDGLEEKYAHSLK